MVTSAKAANIGDLLSNPDHYPLQIDFQRQSVHFVHMSREAYVNSVFLDLRTRHGGSALNLRLDDLMLISQTVDFASRPLHLILHTSFCCSTLLARQFEVVPSCFVLKEPRLLAQIALTSGLPTEERRALLEMALVLLTRGYEGTRLVVIKPNDWCNSLAPEILAAHPNATASFLYIPLKSYLLAVLKSEERRDWARKRAKRAAVEWAEILPFEVDPGALQDAEVVAYLWMAQRVFYRSLASGVHASRCLSIDGEQLALTTDEHLRRLVAQLRLPLSDHDLSAIRSAAATSKYSKDPARPFDAESHSKEMKALEQCWAADLEKGQVWASNRGIDPSTWS